jgi:pilus assembly protein CpaE
MKIVILAKNTNRLESLSALLTDPLVPDRKIKCRETDLDGLAAIVAQELPDLVIVDQLCSTSEQVLRLEPTARQFPGISFILLGNGMIAETLMHAMHVGVKDVLPLPYPDERLSAAVKRIEQTRTIGSKFAAKAHVSAFFPCKGGSGSTFLATNVAYLLSSKYKKRTLLVDLDWASGDACLFIATATGSATISELAKNMSRLDTELLKASTIHVLPNLDALDAPETLALGLGVRPEHLDMLINLAGETYDCIVFNLGRTFDPVTIRALDRTHAIVATMQLTIPFVRAAKRILATLAALGAPEETIHLVVNRYKPSTDIKVEDVEQALGRKVSFQIPSDYDTVSKAINRGVALVASEPNHPISKKLSDFCESFFGMERKEKPRWFEQLTK